MTALEPVVRFGDTALDFCTFRGRSWDGRDQILTPKTAMILKMLAERDGGVIWRDDISVQALVDAVHAQARP